MASNPQLIDLEQRLGDVIRSRCNSVGCKNCDLKWDGGCSATELQNQIHDIELAELPKGRTGTLVRFQLACRDLVKDRVRPPDVSELRSDIRQYSGGRRGTNGSRYEPVLGCVFGCASED